MSINVTVTETPNVDLTVATATGINLDVNNPTHNSLDGIQGGQQGEYYHLTASQYASLDQPNITTATIVDALGYTPLSTETDDQTLQEILDATPSATGTINVDAFSGVSGVLDVIQATGDLTLQPLGSDGNGGKLILDGDSFSDALQIENNGYINWGATTYRFGLGPTYWQWKSWSKPIEIQGGAGTVMYIGTPAGDGKVGIGTTSPSEKLQVISSDNIGTTKIISAYSLSESQNTSLGYNSLMGSYSLNIKTLTTQPITLSPNSSEAMRITASGNVGIGTTSPVDTLDVKDSNPRVRLIDTTVPNDPAAYMWNSEGSLLFRADVTQARANTYIRFDIDQSEKLRITDGGNVGIGTTSPSNKLTVTTSTISDGVFIETSQPVTYAKLYNSNSESFPVGNLHLGYGSNSTAIIQALNNRMSLKGGYTTGGQISFSSASSEIMRMTSTGLGIGTTSPSHPLEVAGNIKGSSFTIGTDTVYSNDLNITNSGKIRIGNAEFFAKSSNDLSIYSGKLTVTSAGNVGIGTSSPTEKLEVVGQSRLGTSNTIVATAAANTLVVESTSSTQGGMSILGPNTAYQYLAFGSPSDSLGALARWNYGNSTLEIGTSAASGELIFLAGNSSQKMRITSAGNVGIGTTSPSWKLHVSSTTRAAILGNGTPWKSDGVAFIGSYYGTHTPLLVDHHNASTDSSNFAEFRNGDDDIAIKLKADGSADFAGDLAVNGGDITLDGTATSTLTLDTSFSFGRELTLSTNGILPTISANSDLLIKTSNSHTQIKLEGGGSTDNIQFIANQVEQVRITTAGVGIGTTSPAQKLHIKGGVARFSNNSSNYLEIDGSDSANNHAIISSRFNQLQFKTNTGAGSPHISLLPATGGDVYVGTNLDVSDNATIDGNVGIGTASPSEKLDVVGNIKASGFINCAAKTVAETNAMTGMVAGSSVYVTDETGGSVMATYDGTNWRRSTDRAIIS